MLDVRKLPESNPLHAPVLPPLQGRSELQCWTDTARHLLHSARLTDRLVGRYAPYMETSRRTILNHAARLAVAEGGVPSLNSLASAAGLSKSGLIHHFRSRDDLLTALAEESIAAVDGALERAASESEVVRTWLELSLPDKQGVALYQSFAAVFFASRLDHNATKQLVVEANRRWEELLEGELGNAAAARAARLLGDGLFLGAISNTISSQDTSTYLETAQQAIYALVEAQR